MSQRRQMRDNGAPMRSLSGKDLPKLVTWLESEGVGLNQVDMWPKLRSFLLKSSMVKGCKEDVDQVLAYASVVSKFVSVPSVAKDACTHSTSAIP
ncbi:hypothetical protein KIPB_013571, partial [Kipferlia bialata]|eukprot:g13571.t1